MMNISTGICFLVCLSWLPHSLFALTLAFVLILLLLVLLLTTPAAALNIFSDSFDNRPALERTLNSFEGDGVVGNI